MRLGVSEIADISILSRLAEYIPVADEKDFYHSNNSNSYEFMRIFAAFYRLSKKLLHILWYSLAYFGAFYH